MKIKKRRRDGIVQIYHVKTLKPLQPTKKKRIGTFSFNKKEMGFTTENNQELQNTVRRWIRNFNIIHRTEIQLVSGNTKGDTYIFKAYPFTDTLNETRFANYNGVKQI